MFNGLAHFTKRWTPPCTDMVRIQWEKKDIFYNL